MEQKNEVSAKKISFPSKRNGLMLFILILIGFFTLSTIVPVFGKYGTLLQVISNSKVKDLANIPKSILAIANKSTELDKTSEAFNITITTQNQEQETEQTSTKVETSTSSQAQNSEKTNKQNKNKIVVIKGEINNVQDNEIVIDETQVMVDENIPIKFEGKPIKISEIVIGSTAIVHAKVENESFIARDITILKEGKSTEEKNQEQDQEDEKDEEDEQDQEDEKDEEDEQDQEDEKDEEQDKSRNSQKEFEVRSIITSITGNNIILKDFEHPVNILDTTSIEENGIGRTTKEALKEGLEVQIHIRYDGTNYNATNIVIKTPEEDENQDKTPPNNKDKAKENAKKP
ncbi:MAG: hypothetical protein K6343_01450 [Caldisericaceae bacterium]